MKQELVTTLSPSDVRLAIELYVRKTCNIAQNTAVTVSLLEAGGAVCRSDPFPEIDLDEIVLGEFLPEIPADEDLPF
jgi:hypothetical protein